MKKLTGLILALAILSVYSCGRKSNINPQTRFTIQDIHTGTIVAKWAVLSDSVSQGVGPYDSGKTYVGISSDYFDFRTDNKLYIKEGTKLDTLTYKIVPDSSMAVTPLTNNAIPYSASIYMVTSTRAVVFWTSSLGNPGSYYSREIFLTK